MPKKKLFRLADEKSYFVFFNDFETEDDINFGAFTDFLFEKLDVQMKQPFAGPYSLHTSMVFDGVSVSVLGDDLHGCGIRVDKGQERVAERIVELCYGKDFEKD